ncbi:unnamed protein product [Rotaria sp. Silwood1]|nr:unnamed protein product [Rotaria sp. Silwood1]CAF1228510.1 unnamed protein product [Rotaria sp. Silwood1]CAF3485946.1 unnamed protein product [Rotaria sp. Silwood1]CAF3487326.1 unnamed protein product [Rotaria sp. Silwood1]CAF3490456.1 unnamed protein product [Rotaria sp. Silwood1]
MPLTDQQLRQELLSYGETVPPITQRNREQLRARLELLRSRPRSPAKSSPTRTRTNASTIRSRPGRGLIELSDSETDTSSNEYSTSRRTGRDTNIQTRSIAVGRDSDRSNVLPVSNVAVDVEESIARHRREIQQLIDSARDRTRAANASIASGKYEPSTTTSIRPNSITSSRHASSIKTDLKKLIKQPSWFNHSRQKVELFWKTNKDIIANIVKALIVGLVIACGLIILKNKLPDLIPQQRGITCTPDNATDCEDMKPIMNSVLKFLQTRTGEVDCGFRKNSDLYVKKPEIDEYLDKKGFKFELGPEARWKTLITYIVDKPVDDIEVYDNQNRPVNNVNDAYKLKATEGIHSLLCRTRRTVHSAMQHLAWLVIGTIAFLTLGWFFKRRSKQREESENTYKNLINEIINLLENQYEEHLHNPEVKPWLAISHIHDMLIPTQDRKRLKNLWERAQKQITQHESRIRAETQLIHGEEFEVWRWIQPRSSSPSPTRQKRTESPHSSNEESYVFMPPDIGLTECLKLRNFFDPHGITDDDEIDLVVDSIQNRCATVKRIEHIGINSIFVYLKFSSKEAAAQGFHLLNNWKYHGREIIAKYLRLERYHEHFPEARESGSTNN